MTSIPIPVTLLLPNTQITLVVNLIITNVPPQANFDSGWNMKNTVMSHLKTDHDWTYWFNKFCRTCASSVGDTMSVWYIDNYGNIAFPCCFAFKLILRSALCIAFPQEFLNSILPNLINQLFPVYLYILTGNHSFLTRITIFNQVFFSSFEGQHSGRCLFH